MAALTLDDLVVKRATAEAQCAAISKSITKATAAAGVERQRIATVRHEAEQQIVEWEQALAAQRLVVDALILASEADVAKQLYALELLEIQFSSATSSFLVVNDEVALLSCLQKVKQSSVCIGDVFRLACGYCCELVEVGGVLKLVHQQDRKREIPLALVTRAGQLKYEQFVPA